MGDSSMDTDLFSLTYDPLQHLNSIFQDSSSLADLPELLSYTNDYGTRLTKLIQDDQVRYNEFVDTLGKEAEKEIVSAEEQSESEIDDNVNDRDDNGDSNDSVLSFAQLNLEINSLLTDLYSTRTIATNTESSITKMTSTIQKLDQSKKNLVLSMTVLKRLQMLLSAYNQLVELVDNGDKTKGKLKNYGEILNLFSVVIELNNHFKSYKSIDEINQLSRNIHALKIDVTSSIFNDFDQVVNNANKIDGDNLTKACNILDILGDSYRLKLVNWFCDTELKEIRSIFGNLKDEAGALENVSRRYLFFKKLLKNYDDQFKKIFPLNWEVDKELASKFCEFNQSNISQALTTSGDLSGTDGGENTNINVESVVESLTSTLEFENFLTNYFTKKNKLLMQRHPELVLMKPVEYHKTISVSFEPFLKFWLKNQESTLNAKFLEFATPGNYKSNANKPENANGNDESEELSNVFPSSADLFRVYKSILSQLIKLSNGEIMIDLVIFFNNFLVRYSNDILRPLIPQNNDYLVNSSVAESIKYLSLIINTSDYIHSTIDQLEEMLQSLIKPEYKEKLQQTLENTFGRTKELFMVNINECLMKILSKIELDSELNFREMLNTNWRILNEVSGASRYAGNLVKTLSEDLQLSLSGINKSAYIRNLLDKLIDLIIDKFLINLVKLKPINDKIPSQILLDLSLLKNFFKRLPFMANGKNEGNQNGIGTLHSSSSTAEVDQILATEAVMTNDSGVAKDSTSNASDSGPTKKYNFNISKSYLNRMNSQFLKLEQLLKVLMVNSRDYSNLINNYLMIVQDTNFENFIKVLILKGVISQPKPIHSGEKKELLKYKEIFQKNMIELNISQDENSVNHFMTSLNVDANHLPQMIVSSPNSSGNQNNNAVAFNKFMTSPPTASLKNFVQSSPIMSGSLQSLSPNLNNLNFSFKSNSSSSSPNLINKENLEKNLKNNLGKFFNRNSES
ncbi:Vps53 protein [Saccharomycopsis crataegensis]|uniref:Vps53 protein n=1 Tax=Saccharomycopsis crataegensis TaxID=43959 RepID=A0AAV5QPS1_9ASCO|nr:Vps53 protein [Saccharomycopsis crataegensis]